MRHFIGAIFALVGLLAGPARAQTPPSAPEPGESQVVQELEVIGRYPGPPLWTVRRGAGEVVILGGVAPLPHALDWNKHRLERLMEGADQVLVPPNGRLGPLDLVYVLLHQGDLRVPGGKTLWDKITPEDRARFEVLRGEAKTEAKRYDRLKPAIAAVMLDSDLLKAMGFSSAKPGSTVRSLAETHHLRVRAEGGIPVVEVFRAVTRMDDAESRACMGAVLDELERLKATGRPLAEAWAVGDLKAVRADYLTPGLDRCVAGAPGLKAFAEKLTRDATSSVNQALDHGGKTIAVIDLRLLLQANGVLDRLKAAGASVDVPRE